MEFQILAIIRGKKKMIPTRSMRIQMGDILIVKGKVEDLLKVKKTAGIEIKPEFKLDDPALQSEDIKIAEVLIPPTIFGGIGITNVCVSGRSEARLVNRGNFSITPSLHHSITPSLHHSITPSLHHSITPPLHHSTTPSPPSPPRFHGFLLNRSS
jgi:hypothetical protein